MPTLCNKELWVLHELVSQRKDEIRYDDYVPFDKGDLDNSFKELSKELSKKSSDKYFDDWESSFKFLTDLGLIEEDENPTDGRIFRITSNGFEAINEATRNEEKDRVASDGAYVVPWITAFMSLSVSCFVGWAAIGNSNRVAGIILLVFAVTFITTALVSLWALSRSSKILERDHPLKCYGVCQWRKDLPPVDWAVPREREDEGERGVGALSDE